MDRRLKIKKLIKAKYELKKVLAETEGSTCYYCDKWLHLDELTLDHIYPKSKLSRKVDKGYKESNSVLSCPSCNFKKSNRVVGLESFRKEVMGENYYPKIFNKKRVNSEIRQKIDRYRKNVFARNVEPPKEIVIIKPTLWQRIKLEWRILKHNLLAPNNK